MVKKEKGFVEAIFDVSFSDFVTVKLVKFIYGAGIIFGGIFVVVTIISGLFYKGVFAGVIAVVFAPVFYILGIIGLRICLEIVIVIFKIEENTRSVKNSNL